MPAEIHHRLESRLKDSLAAVILDDLEGILEKIADELRPDQVFEVAALKDWLLDEYNLEDLFDEAKLEAWARENGWSKET